MSGISDGDIFTPPDALLLTNSAPIIDGLKQNRLSANNNDNARKRELIKNILATKGQKTMILQQRKITETTFENPSGYTKRKIIIDDKGAKIILALSLFCFSPSIVGALVVL